MNLEEGLSLLESLESDDSSPSSRSPGFWRMSGKKGRILAPRHVRADAVDADAESCSSSLRGLSFDSSPERSPSGPSGRLTRSSRKKLAFGTAPATTMRTPSEEAERAEPPPLRNRWARDDRTPPGPPSAPRAPPARHSLFGIPLGTVPVGRFYSETAGRPERPERRLSRPPSPPPKRADRRMRRRTVPALRLAAAVAHKIRPPKRKAPPRPERAVEAIEAALRIMDDSPLNEYILKCLPSASSKIAEDTAPESRGREPTPDREDRPSRPPGKFFKSAHSRVPKYLPEPAAQTKRKPPSDAFRPEIDDEDTRFVQDEDAVRSLLEQWTEEEIPKDEPLIADHAGALENARSLLHGASPTDIFYIEGDSRSSAETDGGYIILEENDENITDNVQSIDSQLEKLDKEIAEIAKKNNMNPDTFLLNSEDSGISSVEMPCKSTPEKSPRKALFPLFNDVANSPKFYSNKTPVRHGKSGTKKKFLYSDRQQYMLDAGQSKFGATQCKECGVIYEMGNGADEEDHLLYHNSSDVLKFNGWKNERFCGRWGEGRVIVINPGDPQSHWERALTLLERVVHPQLGYAAPLKKDQVYKIFLFIEKKTIKGCLVAEPLEKANKFMVHNNVDCCSRTTYPVKCGVSRIWTHMSYRKQGIATKLMNSMRTHFMYGHILACEDIAFTSPTSLGKCFIEKYCQSASFNVYLI